MFWRMRSASSRRALSSPATRPWTDATRGGADPPLPKTPPLSPPGAPPAPLDGRDQRRAAPAQRKTRPSPTRRRPEEPIVARQPGDQAARRSLEFYDAVARRLAGQGGA